MHWDLMIALIIAIPVMLLPVTYFWYLDIGGIYTNLKAVIARRLERAKR